jgi:membrane fusion protein (multidrug efflux system)
MKSTLKFSPLFLIVLLAFSCGSDSDGGLDAKKAELEKLKAQSSELAESIMQLEAELAGMDPDFAKQRQKTILITTDSARKGIFEHFVEVTGFVLSKKNVSISSEAAGIILEVPAIEGMRARKGQVLARINTESIQRNIDELQNSLDLAVTLFEKQERLWKQQIGTEVQYLESKNRKEGLERSLKTFKTQLDKGTVRAPFDGTVESVRVRTGELVQPGMAMVQFVGENDLFIEADISESYVSVLKKGDFVNVVFPSINQEFKTKVSAIGSIINPNNRTFKVEVFLPKIENLKPNMISVLKIKDYENPNGIIVPSHLILSDNKGDYIFTVVKNVAKKTYLKRGKTFGDQTEITQGLEGNEVLVDKGFREVGDNFNVKISDN